MQPRCLLAVVITSPRIPVTSLRLLVLCSFKPPRNRFLDLFRRRGFFPAHRRTLAHSDAVDARERVLPRGRSAQGRVLAPGSRVWLQRSPLFECRLLLRAAGCRRDLRIREDALLARALWPVCNLLVLGRDLVHLRLTAPARSRVPLLPCVREEVLNVEGGRTRARLIFRVCAHAEDVALVLPLFAEAQLQL